MTATLTTLVIFNDANGAFPDGDLIADANGDLFGPHRAEAARTVTSARCSKSPRPPAATPSTPTTLVRFNDANGEFPEGSLIADANGDLFGTTEAAAPTTTARCSRSPRLPWLRQHAHHTGQFQRDDGAFPEGSLIADANGDLFGTTEGGGANDDGTVFEIAKTAGGYASTPTTLVSFNGADGAFPEGSLIADANGDLFGTTLAGGANDDGTVFEIAKTAAGYASTPTTLVSFTETRRRVSGGQSDRRRQRRPVRHDHSGRRERRRHGVRDRQDCQWLRQHAHHSGQLQRPYGSSQAAA